MSSDLFAAFSEATTQTQTHTQAQAQAHTHDVIDDDDDFGDFEEADDTSFTSTATDTTEGPTHIPGNPAASYLIPEEPEVRFPPKVTPAQETPPPRDSKIGKHPFAGHMDFLFEAGDDEYDAGQDDLANLANDPEAAMAYSKRIIAEQEAQLAKNASSTNIVESTRTPDRAKSVSHAQLTAGSRKTSSGKLTKSAPNVQPAASSNPPRARNKLQKHSGYAPAMDPDVLFDVENVSNHDSDDEFGDFEDPTTPGVEVRLPAEPASKKTSLPEIDLLGLEEPPAQTGRVRSSSIRKAEALLGPTKHHKSSSLSNAAVLMAEDNPWDDFEPQSVSQAEPSTKIAPSLTYPDDDGWDDFEAAEPKSQLHLYSDGDGHTNPPSVQPSPRNSQQLPAPVVPPTNIPPPALLLSLFPSLFSSAHETLFLPLSRLDAAQRNQLLAHPATHAFLRNTIHDSIVLAHILAGRKHRWKRDQILAQGMRIGQAGAGGKSGMKLSSIDKGEAAQEQREAAEALRLWKHNVGKLRGAITSAKTAATKITFPAVPDISETMPIKTLKAVEGGFTAPHACALCGLKREERVTRVDVDVDDSFGEWWVQGMDMHVKCRKWWDSNKNKLKTR